jgi:phosphoribosylformylglycinamidine synthase PurS subunit
MRYAIRVEIRGLEGVADPAGQTIERALPALGFSGIDRVEVAKVIRFSLEAADATAASELARSLCDKLLVNTVIERGEITVLEDDGVGEQR